MVHHLDDYLRRGGFPQAVLEPPDQARRTLQHYFVDILERDLVVSRGLDPRKVRTFGAYMAKAFARPHSKRSLERATGLSTEAILEYLEALTSAYVLLPCSRFTWSPKPTIAQHSPSKYYLADPGLREAVAGPGDLGRLAENAVAVALESKGHPLHYWKEEREVDFVVPRTDGRIDGLQVTYGGEVPDREVKALMTLHESLPKSRRGRFLVLTRHEDDGKQRMPLWRWLLETAIEEA